MWRYREALPIQANASPVTLGEGMTPLIERTWGRHSVHFKLDYLCPSGSFKDRGNSILVTNATEMEIDHVLEDSSGNAGASMAAYAAAAGLRCDVYVPEQTSPGKVTQAAAHGAHVAKIVGNRRDTAIAAEKAADSVYYASHNWNPLFLEGVKTVAFEIWEQLGWQRPDQVVVPAGYGSLILGCYLGFSLLKEQGLIARLPRLVAVQTAACSPLARAWAAGWNDVPPVEPEPTMAEGIVCTQPLRGQALLKAVRTSGGEILAIEEDAIWQGLQDLASSGFYVEPTSAVVAAALDLLKNEGRLHGCTVAVLSGTGLKATDKITRALAERAPELPKELH